MLKKFLKKVIILKRFWGVIEMNLKRKNYYLIFYFTIFTAFNHSVFCNLSRWSRVDTSPIYTSSDPYDFLTVCTRNRFKDCYEECCDARFRLTLTPFTQNAENGTPRRCLHPTCLQSCTPLNPPTGAVANETVCSCAGGGSSCCSAGIDNFCGRKGFTCSSALGDLDGPWNIAGLFYHPPTAEALLEALKIDAPDLNFCRVYKEGIVLPYEEGTASNRLNLINDPNGSDFYKNFAFFTVPIKYRKYGVRFEGEFAFAPGLTLRFLTGVASIRQTPRFIDRSCSPQTQTGRRCAACDCGGTSPCTDSSCTNGNCIAGTEKEAPSSCCPPPSQLIPGDAPGITTQLCANNNCCIDCPNCNCKTLVIDRIMKRMDIISRVLNVDVTEYLRTAMEDTEIDLNFARLYEFNKSLPCWYHFILTPFISVGFTIPTGATDLPNKTRRNLFALPFGNNGHWSYGGSLGFTFDFVDTFTIGVEGGTTIFAPKNHHLFPFPTQEFQSGIYPTYVDIRIKPGTNWNFNAYMACRDFVEHCTVNVQYQFIGHEQDKFKKILTKEDPEEADPQMIRKLQEDSSFQVHLLNLGFTYDLTQSLQIGIIWQIPVGQHNAYRSTTFAGSIQFNF